MGTTKTAIEAGENPVLAFTIAIEGYNNLITSWNDTSQFTSWATRYTAAIRGLQVPGEYTQTSTPFRDRIEYSTMQFAVFPDESDTFAKDVFATEKATGAKTELNEDLNVNDLTITVKSNADFASSGTCYIGTEGIPYTSKTSTTVLNVDPSAARGRKSPFYRNASDNFGRHHERRKIEGAVVTSPLVTDFPRVWVGRWVGCWVSRVVDGTVDTQAQSELIFAGRIADLTEAEHGAVILSCTDAREVLATSVLMHDQYRARPQKGVPLTDTLDKITVIENYDTTADAPVSNQHTLTVGVTGAPDLDSGQKSLEDIVNGINTWLEDRVTASDFDENISLGVSLETGFVNLRARITIAALRYYTLKIALPHHIAGLLGFDISSDEAEITPGTTAANPTRTFTATFDSPSTGSDVGLEATLPPGVYGFSYIFAAPFNTEGVTGTWISQGNQLPHDMREGQDTTTGDWGILNYGDMYFLADRTSDTVFTVYPSPALMTFFAQEYPWKDNTPSPSYGYIVRNDPFIRRGQPLPKIKQVIVLQMTLEDFLLQTMSSTGVATYNHATYDTLDRQLGLAIPWDVLGTEFVNSVQQFSRADYAESMTVVLEEPTSYSDILISELALRGAFFVMREGQLSIASWARNHSVNRASQILTASDKAAPPEGALTDVAAFAISREFIINSMKIEFGRTPDDKYLFAVEVSNEQSKTDHGQTSQLGIKMRNTLIRGQQTIDDAMRDAIVEIAGTLLANFNEPALVAERSFSFDKFFMAPSDVIDLTDNYIRDVTTGNRGVTSVAAYAVEVTQNWNTGRGRVRMIVTTDQRTVVYSPAANILTHSSGTITIDEHRYTLSDDNLDGTHFDESDAVTIIERSPPTIGSPQQWNRTISSKTNNTTFVLSSALTGFSGSKEYYMISQVRTNAQATQQVDAYLGDATDGLILGATPNYKWGAAQAAQSTSTGFHLAPPSTASTAVRHDYPADDGTWETEDRPCHPEFHQSAVRTVNNLISHRTAPQGPTFLETAATTSSTSYELAMFPFLFFLGQGYSYSEDTFRTLAIAPVLYIATSGTATCRVTSSRRPPRGDSLTVADTFTGEKSQIEFTSTATSRTSAAFVTAQSLRLHRLYEWEPTTWLTVEIKSSGGNQVTLEGFHVLKLQELGS